MEAPLATSKWWKEERDGVVLDYNQNAKDRTTCSASSRPLGPPALAPRPWQMFPIPTVLRMDITKSCAVQVRPLRMPPNYLEE
jgi:bifunctional non-homologous end joining protein LigD